MKTNTMYGKGRTINKPAFSETDEEILRDELKNRTLAYGVVFEILLCIPAGRIKSLIEDSKISMLADKDKNGFNVKSIIAYKGSEYPLSGYARELTDRYLRKRYQIWKYGQTESDLFLEEPAFVNERKHIKIKYRNYRRFFDRLLRSCSMNKKYGTTSFRKTIILRMANSRGVPATAKTLRKSVKGVMDIIEPDTKDSKFMSEAI